MVEKVEKIQNPCIETRKRLGFSRIEVAARTGLSYHCIYITERGTSNVIPQKLLSFFSAHDIDTEALKSAYTQYRQQLQAL